MHTSLVPKVGHQLASGVAEGSIDSEESILFAGGSSIPARDASGPTYPLVHALLQLRLEVESSPLVHAELEWIFPEETLAEKERCKIRAFRQANIEEEEHWEEYIEWLVKIGEQFYAVFSDRIQRL